MIRSVVTVRKEVEKTKEKIMPKPKDELWVIMWVPPDGDPHVEDECVEMYSGKKVKCKYGELDQKLEEHAHVGGRRARTLNSRSRF